MIDVKTYEKNSGRKYISHIEGTVSDIFKDVCYIVRGVYDAIKKNDQEDAEDLKELLMIALNDDQFWRLEHSSDESVLIDFSEIKSGGPT